MYPEKYIQVGEKVDPEGHIICFYRIKSSLPIEKAAAAIAAEQSTGTWTGISTLNEKIFEKLSARVIDIDGNLATIAYPIDDLSVDIGSVPQILSLIAGNLFGLEALDGVRLEDVQFPQCVINSFPGPRFGVGGLRSILKRPWMPLIGTIVKPKIGLSPTETADYVYEVGMGGLTNSKDDETLVNQSFCPIQERTQAIAEAIDRVREETGHRMIHAINISTRGDRILEVADIVQDLGATEIMVDVLTTGFGALQALADDPSIKIPVHVHRTMHAAITRNKEHGIAMRVFAKLVRMCGGDALHIGTFGVGKMEGDPDEDRSNQDACVSKMRSLKPVMPVCSGGLHPGLVHKLIEIGGNDLQIQAGGGVAGHPGGVRRGAMAMCQAVEAAFNGIPAEKYAEEHEELRIALEHWGRI